MLDIPLCVHLVSFSQAWSLELGLITVALVLQALDTSHT